MLREERWLSKFTTLKVFTCEKFSVEAKVGGESIGLSLRTMAQVTALRTNTKVRELNSDKPLTTLSCMGIHFAREYLIMPTV